MNEVEVQKRTIRSSSLDVLKVDDNNYFVSSSKGKICYRVYITDDEVACSCGDFVRNVRNDPTFQCKHIIAVFDSVDKGNGKHAEFLEKRKPKLDERFIVNIEGRDFVKYAGLLDLAHQKGLLKMEVDLLQYPTSENNNLAVAKAVATSKSGEVFIDVGDANPSNCNSKVAKHLIRMSSTRAKARALRDMTNIGMTAIEELGDLDDVIGDETVKPAKRTPLKKVAGGKSKKETKAAAKKKAPEKEDKSKGKEKDSTTPEPKMSEAQKRAVYNLSRRRGISVEELEKMVQGVYGTDLENLTSKNASEFIRQLQMAS